MLIRATARERPRPTVCHADHDLDWLTPTVATCPCCTGVRRWVWVLRGGSEVQWAGQLRCEFSDAALALADEVVTLQQRVAVLEEQVARQASRRTATRQPRTLRRAAA